MNTKELFRQQRDDETRVIMPAFLATQNQVQELFAGFEVPEDSTDKRVVLLSRSAVEVTYLACDEIIRQLQLRKVPQTLLIGAGDSFKECMFTAASRRGYMTIRVGTSEDLVFE